MKLWTDGRRTTDDGRRTDAGETGILLAQPRAFGSGELKSTESILFSLKPLYKRARSPEFCLKLTYRYLLKAGHVPVDNWEGVNFGPRGII